MVIRTQSQDAVYSAPLAGRERVLLAEWERARTGRVTRSDLVSRFGEDLATELSRSLVRKGVLRRVGPGVFLVVPLRAQVHASTPSAAVAVAGLLADEPYYLGGLFAFSFHGLTEQQFLSRLDAFVLRRRARRTMANALVRFHVTREENVMNGAVRTTIEGTDVMVATRERALLDALDFPKVVGGLRAALRLTTPALGKVDLRALVRLAAAGSRVSTCQRLGVLLSRQGAAARVLGPLVTRVQENRSLVSLFPDMPRRGRVNALWRVVENDGQ